MEKIITAAVLDDISKICRKESCGTCPFDIGDGCPFMYAPEHWDAEQIVEKLDDYYMRDMKIE